MSKYSTLLDLIDQFEAAHEGYDQGQRWTWLDRKNRKIIPNMEADCSASCMGLAWLAGYPVNIDGTCYTGNAVQLMTGAGWHSRDARGMTVDQINAATTAGDMLLGDGHIMIKARNGLWLSCNIDENGRASGGRAGEQNPNESSFRPLWLRRGGWLNIISAPDKATPSQASPAPLGTIQKGSKGAVVKSVQAFLMSKSSGAKAALSAKGGADGDFGDATAGVIMDFQRTHGLTADGICGPLTFAALTKAGWKL